MQQCPRCLEGQMQWEEDGYGWFLVCMQCGHEILMDEAKYPYVTYTAIRTEEAHDLRLPHVTTTRPWLTDHK